MTLSKQEFIALDHEWRLKLKESGFKDIEFWDNSKSKKRVRFIRGHVRWFSYKTKAFYLMKSRDTECYFRVIGVYINHCKTVPDKYKKILEHYVECGLVGQAIKKSGLEIPVQTVWSYIVRNFAKMLTFVNALDDECINE